MKKRLLIAQHKFHGSELMPRRPGLYEQAMLEHPKLTTSEAFLDCNSSQATVPNGRRCLQCLAPVVQLVACRGLRFFALRL